MSNNNKPLVITLNKVHNGYTFHSLTEITHINSKSKKLKAPQQKNLNNRLPNRLIKEIGISNEQILAAQSAPQQNSQQLLPVQPQQIYNTMPIIEQQEVFCQVDRQTELPQNPAKWFNIDQIHQNEKKQLKQYFDGNPQKTPTLYKKYRNFIYEAYKRNPKKYLTKISCRKILRGDVNSISKIHNFLQKHGIINFCVGIDGNYNFKVTSLLKPFNLQTKPQTCIKSFPKEDEETAEKQIDTDNMTLTVINKNFSRTFRAYCNLCKLICGVVWFANLSEQQSTQKNICFQCFQTLPSVQKQKYSKVDIVKKMQITNGKDAKDAKNNTKVSWNIQDNIKLLDFMGNSHNKSWKELLDQFQNKKTIEDIVLQFMQFPISNFDPLQQKKRLQMQLMKSKAPKKLAYQNEDYLNILLNFYNGAEHFHQVKKQEVQAKKQQLPQSTPNLLNLIKLMKQKYETKIKYLTEAENMIQDKGMILQDEKIFFKTHNYTIQEQKEQISRKSPAKSQQNAQSSNQQINDQ